MDIRIKFGERLLVCILERKFHHIPLSIFGDEICWRTDRQKHHYTFFFANEQRTSDSSHYINRYVSLVLEQFWFFSSDTPNPPPMLPILSPGATFSLFLLSSPPRCQLSPASFRLQMHKTYSWDTGFAEVIIVWGLRYVIEIILFSISLHVFLQVDYTLQNSQFCQSAKNIRVLLIMYIL